MLACALRSSSSQKSRSASARCDFREPYERLSIIRARRIHSFRIEPQVCGKLSALRQKCHFATRNLIIKKCNIFCHPERSGGKTAAKSKDLYKNKDDIRIEIPRQARDDRGEASFLCHPERSGGVAAAKSKDLYLNFVDIFMGIHRQARDGGNRVRRKGRRGKFYICVKIVR